METVEFASLAWLDWFNNRRPLEPVGNIAPADAGARAYAQTDELDMVAWLKRKQPPEKPGRFKSLCATAMKEPQE